MCTKPPCSPDLTGTLPAHRPLIPTAGKWLTGPSHQAYTPNAITLGVVIISLLVRFSADPSSRFGSSFTFPCHGPRPKPTRDWSVGETSLKKPELQPISYSCRKKPKYTIATEYLPPHFGSWDHDHDPLLAPLDAGLRQPPSHTRQ